MLRARLLVSLCLLAPLVGCGGEETGEGETGESDTGETETGGEVSLDEHGVVRVQVLASGGDATVFADTASVVVTVHYLDCLEGFYRTAGSGWKQSGSEGGPVFEAFTELLCTEFGGPPPACSVTEILSTVDAPNNEFTLAVTYAVEDASNLDQSSFVVGPLPVGSLAGCEPVIQVRSAGVSGLDSMGNQLWRIGTVSGGNEAKTDDLLPVSVEIVPQ